MLHRIAFVTLLSASLVAHAEGRSRPPPRKSSSSAAPAPTLVAANTQRPSAAFSVPPTVAQPGGPKSLGVVALELPDSDRTVARQANAQLRATLAAISHLPLAEVKLPEDLRPTQPDLMSRYAMGTDLDRVVGGEIVTKDGVRMVHLLSASQDGRSPIHVQRSVRDLSQEELVAAIESAACEAAMDAGRREECVGELSFAGVADGAELFVDGKSQGLLPLSMPVTVTVGAHDVVLERAGDTAARTRAYVHLKSNLKLHVAGECGSLYFLQPDEKPECKLPMVIVEESRAPRWKPIAIGATGVVLATVGVIFGVQANARAADLNTAYAGAGLTRDMLGTLDDARSNATRANVLVGLGAALAAAGATLYVLDF